MVKANPRAYVDPQTGAMLPGDTITILRNFATGEEKGLRHLSVLLAQRELELREQVTKDNETKT